MEDFGYEERKRAMLEALAQLDEISRDMPPVDAVKIARESREHSNFLFP